jgi:sec-independent protein translocase protein TatC
MARTRERPARDGRMTVVEHLTELRQRLVYSLMAIGAGAVLCFVFFEPIIALMVRPYENQTDKVLYFTGPLEAFLTRMKVAGYGGLVLASPVVLWHLWRFVTPGLYPHEKRYAIPFVVSSVVLFLCGATVAVLTLPKALSFLLGVGGPKLEPLLTAGNYLSLVFMMLLAFGAAFEFPVLMTFLLLARVLTTRQLRSWRRYSFLVIVVFAAIITPSQDPFSLFAMVFPMYVLYEAAILVGRLLKR